MFVLLAMLMSTAHASSVMWDGKYVSSPYGPVTSRSAKALCDGPSVSIAKITKVQPYTKKFYNDAGTLIYTALFSKLTLKRERVARGPKTSTFTVDVRGGTSGGRTSSTSRFEPQPVVGHRYLLGLYFHVGDLSNSDWPKGQAMFGAVFTLDPEQQLPSNQDFKSDLEAWCNSI